MTSPASDTANMASDPSIMVPGLAGMAPDLANMDPNLVHAHVRAVLATPSGRVLRAWLKGQCFMNPAAAPKSWSASDQVQFRYGRMTLFQALEHLEDPANFRPARTAAPNTKE